MHYIYIYIYVHAHTTVRARNKQEAQRRSGDSTRRAMNSFGTSK